LQLRFKSVIFHLARLLSGSVFVLNDLWHITDLFHFLPEQGTLSANGTRVIDIEEFSDAAILTIG
jgi:hypothetical protein